MAKFSKIEQEKSKDKEDKAYKEERAKYICKITLAAAQYSDTAYILKDESSLRLCLTLGSSNCTQKEVQHIL